MRIDTSQTYSLSVTNEGSATTTNKKEKQSVGKHVCLWADRFVGGVSYTHISAVQIGERVCDCIDVAPYCRGFPIQNASINR